MIRFTSAHSLQVSYKEQLMLIKTHTEKEAKNITSAVYSGLVEKQNVSQDTVNSSREFKLRL